MRRGVVCQSRVIAWSGPRGSCEVAELEDRDGEGGEGGQGAVAAVNKQKQ